MEDILAKKNNLKRCRKRDLQIIQLDGLSGRQIDREGKSEERKETSNSEERNWYKKKEREKDERVKVRKGTGKK